MKNTTSCDCPPPLEHLCESLCAMEQSLGNGVQGAKANPT